MLTATHIARGFDERKCILPLNIRLRANCSSLEKWISCGMIRSQRIACQDDNKLSSGSSRRQRVFRQPSFKWE